MNQKSASAEWLVFMDIHPIHRLSQCIDPSPMDELVYISDTVICVGFMMNISN